MNKAERSDHSRTTLLSNAEVRRLSPQALHDYFAPCLRALDLDNPIAHFDPAEFVPLESAAVGKVYFVGGAGGMIKIGFTQRPASERLADYQAGSPVPLKVLAACKGTYALEAEYHKRFAAHRRHGEWFEPHPGILAEAERLTIGHTNGTK